MNLPQIIAFAHLAVQRIFCMVIIMNDTQLWEIDTRHWMALTAIARTRSISRAAEELGYGQSSVSQQLAALERVVGARLVDRGTGPRPVTLTEAGLALLPHAAAILERLTAARSQLFDLQAGNVGNIRVGVFQSAGARLLPDVLAKFKRDWPGIAVQLHGSNDDRELAGLVTSNVLDVTFLETGALTDSLSHAHLLTDLYVALVPPNHSLATRATISLSDFEHEDMVFGTAADPCGMRGDQAMKAAGFEPRVVFRVDDNMTRQRLVHAGLGCSIGPALTVEAGLPDGAVIVALHDEIRREICLAWSSERTASQAVMTFVDAAKSVVGANRQ
jgi:molybdate transport repressor ModE-like protein